MFGYSFKVDTGDFNAEAAVFFCFLLFFLDLNTMELFFFLIALQCVFFFFANGTLLHGGYFFFFFDLRWYGYAVRGAALSIFLNILLPCYKERVTLWLSLLVFMLLRGSHS